MILLTVLGIIVAVALAGAIAAFIRDRIRYRGYREIMRDAIAVAKRLHGDIFRDGEDLVVSGAYTLPARNSGAVREPSRTLPVVVRFSHAETTPGFHLRMGAPATFKLAMVPRSETRHYETRALLRSPDENFNSRFECRTDQPMQARMFLDARNTMPSVRELCRTSHHALSIADASVEFSELGSPSGQTLRSVDDRLRHLGTLVQELAAMPDADRVAIERIRKPRHIILRATIVVGIIAVIAGVWMIRDIENPEPQVSAAAAVPEGIAPDHAAMVGDLAGLRLAQVADMDDTATGWLRARGREFSGNIKLDMNGSGEGAETAYILVTPSGEKRVVVVGRDRILHDARFSQLLMAAPFPKQYVSETEWTIAPQEPRGDGLLLVRSPEDTGVVIFINATGTPEFAAPRNYLDMRLRY